MFRFKNHESLDFNIKVLSSNHRDCIKKRIERIQVPGRTGDLLLHDGSKENLDLNIKCLISLNNFPDLLELEEAIYKWLDSSNYETIEFKDGTILKAFFTDYSDRRKLNKSKLIVTFNFTAYKEDN